jgi:protein-disulfide isomerase
MLGSLKSVFTAFALGVGGLGLVGAVTPMTAALAQDVDKSLVQEMALGAEDAPITVIEYASYTCPHCKSFHENVFKDLKSNYIDTGKVRFIYREAYFDRYALWAALVTRCGGEMKYFGLSDMMFSQQSEWTKGDTPAEVADNLRTIGRQAGLTNDEVDACLQNEDKAKAMIAVYQENFERDGITGTPSFLINGEKYSNMNYTDFSKILDEKLGQ